MRIVKLWPVFVVFTVAFCFVAGCSASGKIKSANESNNALASHIISTSSAGKAAIATTQPNLPLARKSFDTISSDAGKILGNGEMINKALAGVRDRGLSLWAKLVIAFWIIVAILVIGLLAYSGVLGAAGTAIWAFFVLVENAILKVVNTIIAGVKKYWSKYVGLQPTPLTSSRPPPAAKTETTVAVASVSKTTSV